MTILPKNLKPSLAGGVLHLSERLIQNRYHWLARPTDSMIVDHVDTANHRAYCRRSDDAAANNEYPYPYDPNMTLSPGDVVLVHWDPTGPYISQGGVQTVPTSVGSGSTPPTGSPNNPPTGGGLVPGGNSCVPQPSIATPGTTGAVPPVGGSNPGSVNADRQGYTCAGAATAQTAPSTWKRTWGLDPANVTTASAPSYDLIAAGSSSPPPGGDGGGDLFYAATMTGPESFGATVVDLTPLASLINTHDFYVGSADRYDQPGSSFHGFVWNGSSWSLSGIGTSPIQPGAACALALWVDCAGHAHYYLGADIGSLQYAGSYTGGVAPLLGTNGYWLWGYERNITGVHGENGLAAHIKAAQFYAGVPGSILLSGDSGLLGLPTTPTTPTSVPPTYAPAYQQGFVAYQTGQSELANPYAGSNLARPWWDAGWIDAYNYYTASSLPGGSGTPPTYGPPATPPASIPSSPTDYRPDYNAGYQAYLDGLPMVPPAADTTLQKQYWQEGWIDAYNAFHVAVGSSAGALPGGSLTASTCLGIASGDGQTAPIPITGDLNVGGGGNFSGCVTAPCVEVNGADVIVEGDARLTDARTPLAHHTTHEPGGSDALDLTKMYPRGSSLPTLPDSSYPNGVPFVRTSDSTIWQNQSGTWHQVGGTTYTLPIASASVLGGVKIGANLSIDGAGVLSAAAGAIYGPLSNGNPAAPDILFDSEGRVVLAQYT